MPLRLHSTNIAQNSQNIERMSQYTNSEPLKQLDSHRKEQTTHTYSCNFMRNPLLLSMHVPNMKLVQSYENMTATNKMHYLYDKGMDALWNLCPPLNLKVFEVFIFELLPLLLLSSLLIGIFVQNKVTYGYILASFLLLLFTMILLLYGMYL